MNVTFTRINLNYKTAKTMAKYFLFKSDEGENLQTDPQSRYYICLLLQNANSVYEFKINSWQCFKWKKRELPSGCIDWTS